MSQDTKQLNSPIEHWSYSSIKMYVANQAKFFRNYVDKMYDENPMSPSMIIGRALHKVCAELIEIGDMGQLYDVGLREIEQYNDSAIAYGKTGSREAMIKKYSQGFQFVKEEVEPLVYDPDVESIMVEEPLKSFVQTESGEDLPLPIKAIADWVFKRESTGEIIIIDWKFLSAFSKTEEENNGLLNWEYFMQAMFNYHTVKNRLKIAPSKMQFREIKLSKNKDTDMPQTSVVEFDFTNPEYRLFMDGFNRFLLDATDDLCGLRRVFLPNFADMMDGDFYMLQYMQGLLEIDLSQYSFVHREEKKELVEKKYVPSVNASVENKYLTNEEKIRVKLQEFGVPVVMEETLTGGAITMFTCKPSRGVKMSEINKHEQDIAIALKSRSVRILAPIPGTDTVGIEVENENKLAIPLTDDVFAADPYLLPIGVNVYGTRRYADLRKMPHLLIAGTTGSGKSVFLRSLIKSILRDKTNKVVLIDPKQVELQEFSEFPNVLDHVTETKDAIRILNKLMQEMDQRYTVLKNNKAKSIEDLAPGTMPYTVVFIDEFADLIMSQDKDDLFQIETYISPKGRKMKKVIEYKDAHHCIVRLAQKARACGIHLVIATQRPSVDVVSGLIKTNFPTRVSFMTSSSIDSKVILDTPGAEKLTGNGDMLFQDPSKNYLERLQGYYTE